MSAVTKMAGTLLTVFLASASVHAQSMALYQSSSSVTSSGVVNQLGGAIGVGTATPATGRLFNVVGSTQFDVTTAGDGPGRVHFNRPVGNYENMLSFENANSYKWLLGLDNDNTDNFRIFSPGGTQLTIAQSTGNVGIGSSAYIPFVKLQVGGDIVASTATTTSPVSCPLIHTTTAYSSAAAPDYTWYGPSNTNTGMFHPSAGVVGFSCSATEKMRITTTGVGVGTTAPLAQFQVGNTYDRVVIGDLPANPNYWTSYIGLNMVRNSAGQWTTASDNANNGGGAIINDVGGSMNFYTFKSNSLGQPMSDVTVQGLFAMRIRNNGRVEIGPYQLKTTSPYDNDLTTPTRLSVDGRIVAKEVVVSVTDFWPDYVFGDNYKLMPLNKLETYIGSNHHLPGFKPASEMEENGIQLSETVKAQMEKIEELTLYIIEQNKKIESLEKRMDAAEQH